METYNGCFNEILWINVCKKSESYLLCYMSSYSMIFGVYDCIRLYKYCQDDFMSISLR